MGLLLATACDGAGCGLPSQADSISVGAWEVWPSQRLVYCCAEALKLLLPGASPSQPEPDAAPTADMTTAAPPSKRQKTWSDSTATQEAEPTHREAVHIGAGLSEHADQRQHNDGQVRRKTPL